MKIAFVNKVFSPAGGGGERHAVSLANSFCSAGHEVHLFCHRAEQVPKVAEVHQVTAPQWPAARKVLAFSKQVRSRMTPFHFDIVYGLTQCYPVDIYRMGGGIYRHWLCQRYPNLFLRRLQCLLSPIHQANLILESAIFEQNHARHIVANSELCKNQATTYYGIPAAKLSVIYNGVDHAVFHPDVRQRHRNNQRKRLGLKSDDLGLLFVAHNWRRKGLETVMKALKHLGRQGSGFKLIAVGRSNRHPFRLLEKKYGLGGRVLFNEPCQEIEKFYAAADLFVLPSLYDPFANVCIEAMACGLPVITSLSNGASEILSHGRSGFVLDSDKDHVSLAGFLEVMMDDTQRRDFGLTAAQSVQKYTIARNAEKNLQVCEDILAGSG
jgi:UDP-glucose:(heptosyl)LPS alpha-1,3-glucosyltransferase